jgi:hypothetical protein
LPILDESRRSDAKRVVLAWLALIILNSALYARAVSFDFVGLDDAAILLGHPNLYNEDSFASSLQEIFVGYFPREEPLLLRDVSWALDARLFGLKNPLGFHLGNVVLNALNVALLFLFLHHATRRFGLALAVASAFSLLTVHVEPVCWVMGRKGMLAAFWMLLALCVQSHELAASDPRRRRVLYLIALLCTVLALLSKLSAVSFFLVLGLHRVFHPYLDGSRPPRTPLSVARTLREVAPRIAPHAALSVLCFVWYRSIVLEYGVIGWRGPGALDPEHILNVLRFTPLVIGQYLKHMAFPTQLSLFYRWPHVEIPLSAAQLLGSAAIAVALLSAALYWCRRRRDLAFYFLTFSALLAPHLSFVYVGFWLADRYLYLASFCVLALVGTLLGDLRERSAGLRYAAIGAALVFAVGSGIQTWRQQTVWRDNDSLWLYEAYLGEPSLLSIQALGKAYVKKAEKEPDPARRVQWIERARVEVKRGFDRERELGRQRGRYKTPDQLHLSRLHYLRGRIAAVEGASLERQVEHYGAAYAVAPDRVSALMLSRAYFELSMLSDDTLREDLVKRSFAYFVDFVRFSQTDPLLLAKSRTMLRANYEGRFPYLDNAIREMKRVYFQ